MQKIGPLQLVVLRIRALGFIRTTITVAKRRLALGLGLGQHSALLARALVDDASD